MVLPTTIATLRVWQASTKERIVCSISATSPAENCSALISSSVIAGSRLVSSITFPVFTPYRQADDRASGYSTAHCGFFATLLQ